MNLMTARLKKVVANKRFAGRLPLMVDNGEFVIEKVQVHPCNVSQPCAAILT